MSAISVNSGCPDRNTCASTVQMHGVSEDLRCVRCAVFQVTHTHISGLPDLSSTRNDVPLQIVNDLTSPVSLAGPGLGEHTKLWLIWKASNTCRSWRLLMHQCLKCAIFQMGCGMYIMRNPESFILIDFQMEKVAMPGKTQTHHIHTNCDFVVCHPEKHWCTETFWYCRGDRKLYCVSLEYYVIISFLIIHLEFWLAI